MLNNASVLAGMKTFYMSHDVLTATDYDWSEGLVTDHAACSWCPEACPHDVSSELALTAMLHSSQLLWLWPVLAVSTMTTFGSWQ